MSFPPVGNRSTTLSHYLSVPGTSVADTWPRTTIYDQDPSILGWTCGNMVASPRDVAKFFYHTLDAEAAHEDAEPLISDASRANMIDCKMLSKGWSAGYLKYGAGLMELYYGHRRSQVFVRGHEGDTYGFLSSQGYVPTLKGGYSIASNTDNSAPTEAMPCYLLQTAQQTFGGSSGTLGCKLQETEFFI